MSVCLLALCKMAVAGVVGSLRAPTRMAFFSATDASESAPEWNTIPGLSRILIFESSCTVCICLETMFHYYFTGEEYTIFSGSKLNKNFSCTYFLVNTFYEICFSLFISEILYNKLHEKSKYKTLYWDSHININ